MSNFGYIKYFAERYKNKKSAIETRYSALFKISKFIGLNFPKFAKERSLWLQRMFKLDLLINMEIYCKDVTLVKQVMKMIEYAQKTKQWITVDEFLNEYMKVFFEVQEQALVKRCEANIERLDKVIDIETVLASEKAITQNPVYAAIECEDFFSKVKTVHSECTDVKEEVISTFLDTSQVTFDIITQLDGKVSNLETMIYFIEYYNKVLILSLKTGLTDPGVLALIQSFFS